MHHSEIVDGGQRSVTLSNRQHCLQACLLCGLGFLNNVSHEQDVAGLIYSEICDDFPIAGGFPLEVVERRGV